MAHHAEYRVLTVPNAASCEAEIIEIAERFLHRTRYSEPRRET